MSYAKQEIDPRLSEIKDCLYRLSVKAIVIEKHKLLLTLEHGNDWWSLPGGGIDYGESTVQSLAREVSEELGIAPEDVHPEGAPLFVTTHAIVDKVPRALLFYRVYISGGMIGPSSNIKTHRWYSAESLESLTLSPSVAEISGELIELMH